MRQTDLGPFLRAARGRLRPQDVGIPAGTGRRRTPGLRREEVADLAGVSITWYTWLEQGRQGNVSGQVIDAVARALRLAPDEHRHVRLLAGLPAPRAETPRQRARPRLQRLVDAAAPNPASVYDAQFDFLAWNQPYVRVRCDPARFPRQQRNLLWMMFVDHGNRARMGRWEPAARAILGQFQAVAAQRPTHPRVIELTAALTEASPEFRDWRVDYRIRDFTPATITVRDPVAGTIALDLYQLRPVEFPDLLMVMQIPATTKDRRRLDVLLADPQ